MGVVLLFFAVAALALGPLMSLWPGMVRRWEPMLTGFIVVSVGGLIILHVLPEAYAIAGGWTLLAALIGLLLPLLGERVFHRGRGAVEKGAFVIAMLALVLHAMVDGLSLHQGAAALLESLWSDAGDSGMGGAVGPAGSGHEHGQGHAHAHSHGGFGSASSMIPTPLALAVILHRVPVALLVWFVGRPLLGTRMAVVVLGLLGAGTIIGYASGEWLLVLMGSQGFGLFQGLAAGMLLHVVVHRADDGHHHHGAHDHGHEHHGGHDHGHEHHGGHDHGHEHDPCGHSDCGHVHHDHGAPPERSTVRKELFGALLGLFLLVGFRLLEREAGHVHGEGYWEHLLSLSLQSAPALLAGYVLAGLLAEFLTGRSLGWISRGSALRQTARGVAFGIPMPICSCGVVPVYRSLVVAGVPTTAGLAFLVATPEIGIDSLLLSFPLLGTPLTLARVAAAFLIAMTVGLVLGRLTAALDGSNQVHQESCSAGSAAPAEPIRERVRRGLRVGFRDVVDDTAPWIVLGLAVAAFIEPQALGELAQSLGPVLEVVFFALAGVPVYVCAAGATPLAAMLILGGVSPGAAIAFLLTGPATNVTTFGVLANLHGRATALRFGAMMALLGILCGWAINLVITSEMLVDADVLLHEEGSLLQWGSLVLVLWFFGDSLRRRGVSGTLHTLFHHSHATHDVDAASRPL